MGSPILGNLHGKKPPIRSSFWGKRHWTRLTSRAASSTFPSRRARLRRGVSPWIFWNRNRGVSPCFTNQKSAKTKNKSDLIMKWEIFFTQYIIYRDLTNLKCFFWTMMKPGSTLMGEWSQLTPFLRAWNRQATSFWAPPFSDSRAQLRPHQGLWVSQKHSAVDWNPRSKRRWISLEIIEVKWETFQPRFSKPVQQKTSQFSKNSTFLGFAQKTHLFGCFPTYFQHWPRLLLSHQGSCPGANCSSTWDCFWTAHGAMSHAAGCRDRDDWTRKMRDSQ